MKKIFLSTMMFASMQLLSASENNYQNLQTTRTDFDDNEYQAQKKFNDNNNNNNDYEDVVEDTRLLTDDYINEMDLNKHISNSDLTSHESYNPFYKKYRKLIVKTGNDTRDAYDYFVKEYEYKIDEFMSMVFLYDTKDNEMVIKFCHPGENGDTVCCEPFRLNEDTIRVLYNAYKEDFLRSIHEYLDLHKIEEIKITKAFASTDQFEAKIKFEENCHVLQTNDIDEDVDFRKPIVKISHHIENYLNLNFISVEDTRAFIDFFFQYAKLSQKNLENNYHLGEGYIGTPGHHCKKLYLQCETFEEKYEVAKNNFAHIDYENNVGIFFLPDQVPLNKNLFEQAQKELGDNYSDIDIFEDDDTDIMTMLLNGKIECFSLDVSHGAYHITPTSDFDCDYTTLDGQFYTPDASKTFIRVLAKTLELMEEKYFDSKKLDDDKKLEYSESSNDSENSNNK